MYRCDPAAPLDRRRRLAAFSRHDATPRKLLLELTADGTDYRVLEEDDPAAAAFAESWQPVVQVLENAACKLTRQQILSQWPADYPQPGDVTLWRLLKQAAAAGRVRCEGTGRQNEPFRYWLPEREQVWRDLYGPEWETLPDTVKATLYFHAQFLKEESGPRLPNAPENSLCMPVLDQDSDRDASDPPGIGTHD